MGRYVQEGKVLTVLCQEALRYGEVFVKGALFGIAAADIPAGALGSIAVSGVFTMEADNTTAFDLGDKLYWDSENKWLTKTPNDVEVGICVEPKTEAAGTTTIKLNG